MHAQFDPGHIKNQYRRQLVEKWRPGTYVCHGLKLTRYLRHLIYIETHRKCMEIVISNVWKSGFLIIFVLTPPGFFVNFIFKLKLWQWLNKIHWC